jgi:hypothetical protein
MGIQRASFEGILWVLQTWLHGDFGRMSSFRFAGGGLNSGKCFAITLAGMLGNSYPSLKKISKDDGRDILNTPVNPPRHDSDLILEEGDPAELLRT